MNPLRPVVGAAYGMHWADQIALVGVPLIAEVVFDAKPSTIGVLVACQSLAQLIGSIPFGLIVDKFRSRRVALASTLISAVGFLAAWISVATANLVAFGVAITFAGFGIVLFVLVVLSMIPMIAEKGLIANANARIEIPRSIASFVVPLTVGVVITAGNAQWFLAAASLGACLAFLATSKFSDIAPTTADSAPIRGSGNIGTGSGAKDTGGTESWLIRNDLHQPSVSLDERDLKRNHNPKTA